MLASEDQQVHWKVYLVPTVPRTSSSLKKCNTYDSIAKIQGNAINIQHSHMRSASFYLHYRRPG